MNSKTHMHRLTALVGALIGIVGAGWAPLCFSAGFTITENDKKFDFSWDGKVTLSGEKPMDWWVDDKNQLATGQKGKKPIQVFPVNWSFAEDKDGLTLIARSEKGDLFRLNKGICDTEGCRTRFELSEKNEILVTVVKESPKKQFTFTLTPNSYSLIKDQVYGFVLGVTFSKDSEVSKLNGFFKTTDDQKQNLLQFDLAGATIRWKGNLIIQGKWKRSSSEKEGDGILLKYAYQIGPQAEQEMDIPSPFQLGKGQNRLVLTYHAKTGRAGQETTKDISITGDLRFNEGLTKMTFAMSRNGKKDTLEFNVETEIIPKDPGNPDKKSNMALGVWLQKERGEGKPKKPAMIVEGEFHGYLGKKGVDIEVAYSSGMNQKRLRVATALKPKASRQDQQGNQVHFEYTRVIETTGGGKTEVTREISFDANYVTEIQGAKVNTYASMKYVSGDQTKAVTAVLGVEWQKR